MRKVIKRDGSLVDFKGEKIVDAIAKAGASTGEFGVKRARRIAAKVLSIISEIYQYDVPSVEEVQDVVEDVLMAGAFKQTAKAYILYREGRSQVRNLDQGLDLMDTYMGKQDWKLKENASSSFSLQGMYNYVTNAVVSKYWLDKVYPPNVREAHETGAIHIHNLNSLSGYCVGWDLQDLLRQGFRGLHSGKVDAGPPKHFGAALGQVFNFLYTLQGEAAGAEAFSSVDTLLAPFIRYDELSYREVKQEIQQLMFNMNVPTRVGYQCPFSNFTLDLVPSPVYRDQPVMIGGELQNQTYGEFQEEMDMFNRAFAEVMYEGDYSGRPFSFPIPTYNVTEDFDWDNPNHEYIWKMTGKFGIPYFANFIGADMDPEDCRSMCCRLKIDNRKLRKRAGGLFASSPLTGSIGVVTLNLPQAAYLAKDEKVFQRRILELAELAAWSLDLKKKTVEQLTENGLYPYSEFYLRSVKEQTGKYWTNHFKTIGLVGMNEACRNLLGCTIADPAGLHFALRTLRLLRDFTEGKNAEDPDALFNLEATPAEGVSYRLALLDKEQYPEIVTAGDGTPYYTNSTFLAVGHTKDLDEALDHQASLQALYTGGTVFHSFLGESVEDAENVKSLVRWIAHNYKVPYFTLTPTYSICPSHGYISGEHMHCPDCGAFCEVFSRVVGYYRPVHRWNDGKQEEFSERETYEMREVA